MVRNASQTSDTDAHVHLPPDVGKAEKAESTSSGFKVDPYAFESGLKTEEELGELRRRRKGVERYHREQNDVRIANWHSRLILIHYLHVFLSHRSCSLSSPCSSLWRSTLRMRRRKKRRIDYLYAYSLRSIRSRVHFPSLTGPDSHLVQLGGQLLSMCFAA